MMNQSLDGKASFFEVRVGDYGKLDDGGNEIGFDEEFLERVYFNQILSGHRLACNGFTSRHRHLGTKRVQNVANVKSTTKVNATVYKRNVFNVKRHTRRQTKTR